MTYMFHRRIFINQHFVVGVYDKRDDFPFNIVQYMPKSSNISIDTLIGIFGSQLIRFFIICDNLNNFNERLYVMLGVFIKLGYDQSILLNKYRHLALKYDFRNKFGDISELECLLRARRNGDTLDYSN